MADTATTRTSRAELVGRESELDELRQALERATQYETPQTVLLVGDQGVGKTRLIEDWLAAVAGERHDLRVLRASGRAGDPDYALFNRLLGQRFPLPEGDEERRSSFREQVEEVVEDRRLAEVLHFLGSFVGVSVRDSPFIRALEDAPRQHDEIARTVLRRWLELDANKRPLLLVLDDLHLADERSRLLVRELADQLGGAPMVIVGAARPELLAVDGSFREREGEYRKIDLFPLPTAEAERLFRGLLAQLAELPEELVASALEMTGGNPLFIEELVAMLLEDGTVDTSTDPWTIDVSRAAEAELPMTVEEAVRARIAVLDAAERDALQQASILGSVFWLGALVCFRRFARDDLDDVQRWTSFELHQQIRATLDGLVERDYLMSLPDSSIPGEVEYAFKHNLERELVAQLVDQHHRHELHLVAAQWLETRLRERSEPMLEYLAQHYEQGGNARRAAYCYIHAGDMARKRFANQQAIVYYEAGLGLLGLEDALAQIEALHNIGDVCVLLGRYEAAQQHFAEMLRLAWLLDHRAKGGAAHRRIGRVCCKRGENAEGEQHLRAALQLFRLADDQRGVAAALDDLGLAAFGRGEYPEALAQHREALAIKRQIGDPRAIAVSLHNIGLVHQDSGSYKEALECFTEALDVRRKVGDRLGVADTLDRLGAIHRARSEYTEALDLWTEALQVAREIGDRAQEAHVLIALGESLVQLGRVKESKRHLDDAAKLTAELGDQRMSAECDRTLAEVLLALGEIAAARERGEAAYSAVKELGLRPQEGLALRTLGEIAAAEGTDDEQRERTADYHQQAIEIFTELGNELELARTFAIFANYHDRCGNWKEADDLRSTADQIFERVKAAQV